jgi:EAL domain-containing protein (putative c-di-GMP-specific phosphodiesterase class I)
MAHNLGMQVVAEGVETKAAYDLLANYGCDIAQGYFIARPLTAADFTHWHESRSGYFRPD